eukprot:GFUD01042492.1.p1 GENE.GFUD01042492.1~~GFUD01042492.1.p1  ORF type:complete len:1017 (-),score=289.29 GFUD01042492.1:159-2987(-)
MEAMKSHENICTGLLVGILTEPNNCIKFYSYLSFVANDGLNFVVSEMNRLLLEKYSIMKEMVQQQLLWLVRELVRNGVPGADWVCWNVMRNIIGGNTSNRNLWLADQMMNIYTDSRAWLYTMPHLVSGVIYTYLRLLEDHARPSLKELKDKEVTFLTKLIRERFPDVLSIGRDFVRLLQTVSRIPEIEQVWQEILHSPSSLSPQFTGVEQLMRTRTPRKYLVSRITPDMEKKLNFLMQNVKFGFHTRYEAWFQRSHLSSQESQSLRPDLVRFIVSVIHPSNDLLQSDVMPRWAVIGWILTTCTNPVASSNVKLALFYDWIFFDLASDSIMNLEPAVLVMHHSMKPHPQITASLLDFLSRLVNNFLPSSSDQVLLCVTAAFQHVQEKGVLPLLTPLLFNKNLNQGLRKFLMRIFQSLYLMENPPVEKPTPVQEYSIIHPIPTVQFSDDEDDSEDENLMIHETRNNGLTSNGEAKNDHINEILSKIEALPKEENSLQSKLVELMKTILSRPVFAEDSKLIAESLSVSLSSQFEGKLFPATFPSPATVQLCLSQPVFSLFSCLSDPRRQTVMELLANLQFLQPRVGYCLLLYLISSQAQSSHEDDSLSPYTEFCQALGTDCSLAACLVRDLTQCQNDDVDLFLYLVPPLYDLLPHSTLGNVPLLYLIVSCVDGSQVQSLVSKIVSQQLTLLHGDTCQPILEASLSWETFEQFAFWQLFNAHDLPLYPILNFLPKLSVKSDAEALTSVMLLLKKKVPTEKMISKCLAREPAGDDFFSALCSFWMKYCEEKLASMVVVFLSKYLNEGAGSKKRRADLKIEKPLTLQLLGHFTPVMKTCPKLFERPAVLEVFMKLSQSCLETTKLNHSEFFDLLESLTVTDKSAEESDKQSSEDDPSPPPSSSPQRKRTMALKTTRRLSAKVNYREVDSSEEEVEEEMMPKKKRKVTY